MLTDTDETQDGVRRLFAAHLQRLADQVQRLARQAPGARDEALIRIVQPGTRRATLVPGGARQLLEGAVELASRGLRVFPAAAATHDLVDSANGKTPLLKRWPERATTDLDQVRHWWSYEYVGANVGVCTGSTSGITIVDLDHRPDRNKDGVSVLLELEDKHGPIPEGPVGERGTSLHLWFAHTPGLRSINGVLPGVDVKSDGGYVIAPPSFHRSGDRYRWRNGTRDLPLPPMPTWLVDVLMPKAGTSKRRRPSRESPASTTSAVALIASSISVDDVLDAYGLDTTPCVCPLHEGADNPKAFTSYADGNRWHCFTNCADGKNDGDTLDLIRRLADCTFDAALTIATRIAAGEPVGHDEQAGGTP